MVSDSVSLVLLSFFCVSSKQKKMFRYSVLQDINFKLNCSNFFMTTIYDCISVFGSLATYLLSA